MSTWTMDVFSWINHIIKQSRVRSVSQQQVIEDLVARHMMDDEQAAELYRLMGLGERRKRHEKDAPAKETNRTGKKGESEPVASKSDKKKLDWNDIAEMILDHQQFVDDEGNQINPLSLLTLQSTDDIVVPKKMDLYEGLDITEKDRLFVDLGNKHYCYQVLFVNGEDRIAGVFNLNRVSMNGEQRSILTADAKDLDFKNHTSTKYYFVFCDTSGNAYKVPVGVSYQETKTTSTHLCIDFGTSNTTTGCFLDERYVDNISNIAIINKNVVLNSENVATFMEVDREFDGKHLPTDTINLKTLVPTIVYIDDCSDPGNIVYSFGYEASRKVKEDGYCPQASCFMEIKRWTSNIDVMEDIQDREGNKARVSRREIISRYLLFIIRTAENQFKCKFKNIHISAPVKLKAKVLGLYAEILSKYGYVLEEQNSIDEGISVLYSIINNQIKDRSYRNGEEEKALIIDCGGGTSDLASCKYKIDKDEDGIINLDITTEYMNGDVNFGGNNLTYRIMQYMKIAYAYQFKENSRVNIDKLITHDVNELFSYIEGELENDDDARVKERYEEVYRRVEEEYARAENVIPTKYAEYENQPKEVYDRIKNNFYFLWELAEEMKKEFYRSTSISRYSFANSTSDSRDIDLHINRVEKWRLSIVQDEKTLAFQDYPSITFTAKEIDKLLRADIYYLVRKFLNVLYTDKTLDTYSQIKLSGQSSKINIFMDSLKEFLPGKKIKSGRIHSRGNDAEELKLFCLKGAIMYLHALEKANIEVSLHNETKNIPITVYIRNENNEDKEMFRQGSDWNQPAVRRRITAAGKEVYLHMKNVDREIGEPYKYVYEDMKYKETRFEDLQKLSGQRITQDAIDNLHADKKYIFVFLNKEKWGFDILPVYRDNKGQLYKGYVKFCSFEMDILQESFFDGRK